MDTRVIRHCLILSVASIHCLIAPLPHWLIDSELSAQAAQSEIALTPGLVISSNTRVKPGTYRLPAAAGGAAVLVRGSNITVDLTGVTIEGGDP
ncbi:MAG: hypothetical protein NUW22_08400, partial [Acidobacteria bacterium]|nr:hypothetical protein [Acidobacteriota bacterium]